MKNKKNIILIDENNLDNITIKEEYHKNSKTNTDYLYPINFINNNLKLNTIILFYTVLIII